MERERVNVYYIGHTTTLPSGTGGVTYVGCVGLENAEFTQRHWRIGGC